MKPALKTILLSTLGFGVGGLVSGILVEFILHRNMFGLLPLAGHALGLFGGLPLSLSWQNASVWRTIFCGSLVGLVSGYLIFFFVNPWLVLLVWSFFTGAALAFGKNPQDIRKIFLMGISGLILGASSFSIIFVLEVYFFMPVPSSYGFFTEIIFLTLWGILFGALLGLSLWVSERKKVQMSSDGIQGSGGEMEMEMKVASSTH